METETKTKNKKSKEYKKNLTKSGNLKPIRYVAKQKPKTKETENPRDSKNKIQKKTKRH